MSGFDSNNDQGLVQVDLTPIEQNQRDKDFAFHQDRMARIQTAIQSANETLASVQARITQKLADLDAAAKKTVADVSSEIVSLTAQRDDLKKQLDDILGQIRVKQTERDSVLNGLYQRSVAADVREADLEKQGVNQGEIQRAIAARQVVLDTDVEAFRKEKETFVAEQNAKMLLLQSQQTVIDAHQADLDRQANTLVADRLDLQARLSTVLEAEKTLEQDVIAAQAELDKADQFKKDQDALAVRIAEADARAKTLDAQEKRNSDDAAQIIVAKIALNDKEDLLAQRERAVQEAEQKIAKQGA